MPLTPLPPVLQIRIIVQTSAKSWYAKKVSSETPDLGLQYPTVMSMHPPRNLKELRGLKGRLAYIRRFIANLSGRCQPFTRLMKKAASFVWDQACQEAYEEIKRYLIKPPVLVAPTSGEPFLLYVRVMDHSLGALLAQKDDNDH